MATTYSIKLTAGTGVSSFTYYYYDSSNTYRGPMTSSSVTIPAAYGTNVYVSSVTFSSGYTYPVTCGSWTMYTASGAANDPYIYVSGARTLTISATAQTTTTYKLNVTCEGCSIGYSVSTTGSTGTLSDGVSRTFDFGTTRGYIQLTSVTPSGGYTHPVTGSATTGTTSWSVTNSSGTILDSTIYAYSGGGVRYVTLSATEQTYTLTYNANGGSGAPSSRTFTSGTSFTLSSTEPTRDGYTFLGWSTSSTATSAMYSAGQTVTFYNTVTLYAVWESLTKTYYGRLTLDANGGAFPGTGYTSISWPTSGAVSGTGTSGALVSFTLPASGGNYVPTRDGYTFVGWGTSSTATSATYYSGGTVSFTAKSTSSSSPTTVTLYAVWRQTFTLSYTTTLSGVTNMPSSSSVVSGGAILVSTVVPVKDGYTFKGWAETANGDVKYTGSESITMTADKTLYAVFEKITLSLFYWNGSDTADATLIAKGQPVSNITATRWNNLLAKISELADACGASFSYTAVSSGDGITAARFNAARTGLSSINTALGASTTLPAAQSSDNTMYASLFNGTGSIKGALNALIEVYNDG